MTNVPMPRGASFLRQFQLDDFNFGRGFVFDVDPNPTTFFLIYFTPEITEMVGITVWYFTFRRCVQNSVQFSRKKDESIFRNF